MSLAVLADHLASKGRNGDSMLVHMTPDEVKGLHALALAHGGKLTINPETGLPEANFLKRLLPTIIGAAVSAFTGIPPHLVAMGIGGFEAVRTGDLGKGISAGLGAYSGATLGAGLSAAGEAGLQAAAGEAAAKTAADQLALANTLGQEEAAKFVQQQVAEKAASFTPYDKLMAGAKGLMDGGAGRDAFMSAMGGTKGLMRTGLGIAAPLMAGEAVKAQMPQTVTSPTARITPYGLFGGREGSYAMSGLGSFTPQEFTEMGGFQNLRERMARGEFAPPPGAAGGGLMSHLADGGSASDMAFVERSEPVVRMAVGGSADPTQQATPTAAQLAAQQSIVADPVKAAREAALSGIRAGMTDEQIANMVNTQYGKSFNAQNVADFMKAQGIARPPATSTPADITFGGDTDYGEYVAPQPQVTIGAPFQPTAPTTEQVRSAYVQGGGRTDMPTITNIQPTDRTYTYNDAFGLLQGYLKANPNAMYRDVVAFANSRGIPEMQAKAAYNEFRFSGMTGGSQQAYDYLMGRGAAPIKPFVQGGGPLSRSYADVMGIKSGYENLKPVNLLPATNLSTTSGAKITEAQRAALGNKFLEAQKTGFYDDFNAMLQELRLMPADLPKLFPALNRDAIEEQMRKGYVKFYEEPISGGKAGGLMNMAGGGLSKLAILGAAKGGNFNLGDYSDGGRLLRGPGDGVSDSIPAVIGGKRPARLADGEFVVPARIVSELGNGSTEAGARKLYKMMERVQQARAKTVGKGRTKVAKNTKADKHLPA